MRGGSQTGAVITSEMIRSYLETLSRRGRSRNTVQMYGAKLRAFYHYLPSDKRVEEAKCNPWCLRKLYLATRSEIERNVRLPAEQAYEQILDTEQLAAGWTENESNSIHKDVCDRLQRLNLQLYRQVRVVLEKNKAERHLRGGEATHRKYKAAQG